MAATGGHLRLVADYPGRPPIELRLAALTQLDDNDSDPEFEAISASR